MEFTMWLGPLPIRWLARIEAVSATGSTDRQVSGPFAAWAHRHTFVVIDDQMTKVVVKVSFSLSHNILRWLLGMGMRRRLARFL